MPKPTEARKEPVPATMIVHWPGGPVPACAVHAAEIRRLGAFLGCHVHVEPMPVELVGAAACANCANQDQEKR